MSGNANSGRPSPVYVARADLDQLAQDVARLLEDEPGAGARCVIELVRALALELPARLNGARWGPPSHARRLAAASTTRAAAPTKASAT